MDIVEWLRDITRPPPTREEAADEIERLREALDTLQAAMVEKKPIPMRFKKAILNANSALQQKDSE